MDKDEIIIKTLAWIAQKHEDGEIDAGEYNMIYQAMGFDLKPITSNIWTKLWFKLFGREP